MKTLWNSLAMIVLLLITYFVVAMLGWTAANSTEVGEQTYHGSDMRTVCEFSGYDSSLCRLTMEMRINRLVAKIGKQNANWSIPEDATEEGLEHAVVAILMHKDHAIEAQDASLLVSIAITCLYPSDAMKQKASTSLACKGVH